MSMRNVLVASLFCSFLGLGHAAADTIWIEGPADAGDLTSTAQSTTGGGALTSILGKLDVPFSFDDYLDIDLFKIFIDDVVSFSATTVENIPVNVSDPQLFLFNALGNGVFMNDDGVGIGSQSALGPLPGGFGAGLYFLAIGWWDNEALDAANQLLFDSLTGLATAAGPLAGWNGDVLGRQDPPVDYEILLTGATPVPEPVTLALFGAGLAAVFARRRSTSSRPASRA